MFHFKLHNTVVSQNVAILFQVLQIKMTYSFRQKCLPRWPLTVLNQLPLVTQVLQRFHRHLKEVRVMRNVSHMIVDMTCSLARAAIQTILK